MLSFRTIISDDSGMDLKRQISLSKLHADSLTWTKNLCNKLLLNTDNSVSNDRNITKCNFYSFMDMSQQYKQLSVSSQHFSVAFIEHIEVQNIT